MECHRQRGHPEPGVGRDEHAAPLDHGELLQERTIEDLIGDHAVLEQPLELRAAEGRGRAVVTPQAPDEQDPHVGLGFPKRVENALQRSQRGIA